MVRETSLYLKAVLRSINYDIYFMYFIKIIIALFALFISTMALAQKKTLPVIKAKSTRAMIMESDEEQHSWTITPGVKPDVHTITKSPNPKWIRFYTDTDSIKVKIKPGQKFDFIVLLNGKDSCYTRIESLPTQNYSRQKRATHDTIPFTLTAFNNIKFKAILNGVDTLDLKFDSGATGLLLTNDAIKEKTHLGANTSTHNTLQIQNLSWGNQEVFPVVATGQGTDGRFGWDFFDGKIVEIDYDKSLFIVHTKMPKIAKGYSKFDIEYVYTLFCIHTDLEVKKKRYNNRFLFDTGYQRTVMLDTVLMNEQNYPKDLEVIKKVIMKNGQGKEIPILTVNNERLNFGSYALFNIPVQLLTTGNPARFKTHILGNEVLKRFNTILDFQKNIVYLKPNSLIDLPYTDAQ